MTLARGAVRHPIATAFFVLTVVLGGFVAHELIELEILPEFKMAQVRIVTRYPGAGPRELESLVTVPIETRIRGVRDVREVSSTTREGSSVVTVSFRDGVDLDVAVADIKAVLHDVAARLPHEADDPVVSPVAMEDLPVIILSLIGPGDPNELRIVAERRIRESLLEVSGVGDVEVHGGTRPFILIEVDQERLELYGLRTDEVLASVRGANLNVPGGRVRLGGGRYLVRTVGSFETVDDIAGIPIDVGRTPPVVLKDVARVEETFYPNENVSRVNGQPNVIINVKKSHGANILTVAKEVLARIEEISTGLPDGVDMVVMYDLSELVEDQLDQVRSAALLGGILAMLVLYVFLRRIATTLIVSIAIPMSILMTLIVLMAAGHTLNFMSLAGLLLALGMVVDDSIVVLENVVRHIDDGEQSSRGAIRGSREVGSAVLASTITTAIVFAPVFLLSDWGPGVFLKVMSFSLVVAVMSSYVVAMSVIPSACALFVRPSAPGGLQKRSRWYRRFEATYRSILRWMLRHPCFVVFITIVVLVLSGVWVASFGFSGDISVQSQSVPLFLSFPPDAGRERMEAAFEYFEGLLREFPEIQTLQGWTNEIRSEGTLLANLGIRGSPKAVDEIKRAISPRLGDVPGVTASFQSVQAMSGSSPVEVQVRGADAAVLEEIADEVRERLSKLSMLTNVRTSLQSRHREIRVQVDRERAALRGVVEGDVATAVRLAVYGSIATRVVRDGREVDVVVRLREDQGGRFETLDGIFVPSRRDGVVPLGEVATITWDAAIPEISRRNFAREVRVRADVEDPRMLSVAGLHVRRAIQDIRLPEGVSIEHGGAAREEAEGRMRLMLSFCVALFLVYAVMAIQFESFIQPLVIMTSLPLAVIGCNVALAISRTPYGVMAAIGVILLSGIVVNDGIVLVDYINQLRGRGMSRTRALVKAGQVRLRPIIMTSTTTIFGVIPMALGIGHGAQVYEPLGIALIGGLTFATILILGIIPVSYVVMENTVEVMRSAMARCVALMAWEESSA